MHVEWDSVVISLDATNKEVVFFTSQFMEICAISDIEGNTSGTICNMTLCVCLKRGDAPTFCHADRKHAFLQRESLGVRFFGFFFL